MLHTTPDLTDVLAKLSGSFGGRFVAAGHADYDALRMVAAGGIDRRPALILRPADARDVAVAVRAAAAADAPLSVRSGGHSGSGHGVNDGGIVIDLRDLHTLEIDEPGRSVWAGSGLTAGEVSRAVTERGLAIGFGDAASVGIGGITTGGGVGYLSRKWGLTIDSLSAAEIVTADGEIRILDATSDPDLFWAIRGGGGNFGVVTRFRFNLHAMPAFTGGMMVLPATAETIDGFLAAAAAAPRELGAIANVMLAPPMPFLKPEVHGQLIILAMLGFAGDDAAAAQAIAPFRDLAPALADFVKPGPYMQMFPPEDASYKPVVVMRNRYVGTISPGLGATILEGLGQTEGMRAVQLRVLGGAIADVSEEATAYAHRRFPLMAHVVAMLGDEAERPAKRRWAETFAATFGTDGSDAAYVNFLGDEGAERVRNAYPPSTLARLQRVKSRVDPGNLFRLNQNVLPS